MAVSQGLYSRYSILIPLLRFARTTLSNSFERSEGKNDLIVPEILEKEIGSRAAEVSKVKFDSGTSDYSGGCKVKGCSSSGRKKKEQRHYFRSLSGIT